jgi:hypothetical protein
MNYDNARTIKEEVMGTKKTKKGKKGGSYGK